MACGEEPLMAGFVCPVCKRGRRRKMRTYGLKSSLGWHCPTDLCYGPDYYNLNKKRGRVEGKKELESQLKEDQGF